MDSINQLAKTFNDIDSTASYASKKHPPKKRVERAADTFDSLIPFEMEFRMYEKESASLYLYFKQAGPSSCCGICYCSYCENFSNETVITLSRGYITQTLNVFVNDIKVTDFEELDPDLGTLRLNTTGASIRICYVYYAGGCADLVDGGGDDEPPTSCITDTFNRIDGSSPGIADAGFTWNYQGEVVTVDGDRAVIPVSTNNNINTNALNAYTDLTVTMQSTGTVGNTEYIEFSDGSSFFDILFSGTGLVEIDAYPNGSGPIGIVNTTLGWTITTETTFHVIITGGTIDLYVWQSIDSEPGSPTLSTTLGGLVGKVWTGLYLGGYGGVHTVYVDDLNIIGNESC